MKSESSQQSPDRTGAEPKPLLVLRANGGSNGKKSTTTGDAVLPRASHTQTLMGTNGQPASVRFRSETRLEYSNP